MGAGSIVLTRLGSGVFGLSTALALARHAQAPSSITIVDRSPTPGPHSDAASSDVSKILRPDYGPGSLYGDIAVEAIARWRDPLFAPHYHESGYLAYSCASEPTQGRAYVEGSLRKSKTTRALASAAEIREASRIGELAGSFADDATAASLNPRAGWANASGACQAVADELAKLSSVRFVSALVTSFIVEEGVARGVRLDGGSELRADLVISCAGAWSPALLPELGDDNLVVASGQYVAHIDLSDAEAERLRDMPVCVARTLALI